MCETSAKTEFGVDPPPVSPKHAFCKHSMRQALCIDENFPLLQIVWMKLEYKLHVYRILKNAHVKYLQVAK
jgi:hypothetical protein